MVKRKKTPSVVRLFKLDLKSLDVVAEDFIVEIGSEALVGGRTQYFRSIDTGKYYHYRQDAHADGWREFRHSAIKAGLEKLRRLVTAAKRRVKLAEKLLNAPCPLEKAIGKHG